VGDEVQGQAGVALFADEVALEEAASGDEVMLGYAGEERDASLDGDQAGVDTAGEDLGGQVDQFGVLAPGADGDRDVPAGSQERRGAGEDFGEAGEEAVVADVGEVAAVEGVAVAVVELVDPGSGFGGDLAVGGGPVGGEVTTSVACPR
jgi:hypothetical protein